MSQKHYTLLQSAKNAGYRLRGKTGKIVYIVETFWGWAAVTEPDKFDKIVYIIGEPKEA